MTPSVGAALGHFQGSFDLSFPAALGELPAFALYAEDRPDAPQPLSSTEYRLERLDPSTSFRITFQPQAAARAGQLKGERCALEVRAHYYHPALPLDVTYRSDAFYLAGMSWERRAIYAGLGVVALNFVLLLGAMRFAALRKIVLNPAAANVAGLVVAKYLVTDQVIRYVRVVRLALFRDYRRRLFESAELRWQDRLYVAPQVEVAGSVRAGAVRWAAEPAWRQVFYVILAQPRRRLWLVEGPSGLGKTALLEQWLAMALEIGETPLLISLRGSSPAIHEAAVLLSQHGDVKISDELALSLVESGGFVLLLDGLNEDGSPEVTRDFVRIVSRNNLVVLTSQFDPHWEASITTRRISLKPFGREQLVQLLDPSWADRILASATLSSEVARLPVTAKLLAQCIRKEGILPRDRLDIYRGLLAGLETGPLLNLEAAAWTLFKTNEFEIEANPGLPRDFCEQCVERGVLTARPDGRYRFGHEVVHRYITARYLDRQEPQPLLTLHKQLTVGQDRKYWTDVLDFWGEMSGRRAAEHAEALPRYEALLIEVAEFDTWIFASRLYRHYDDLVASGMLAGNPKLIALSARQMAVSLGEREP